MSTHHYPTTRKPRDISYSKSYKLFQLVGEDKFRELFEKNGMYNVAKHLSLELNEIVSPYVCRHIRTKYIRRENHV